MDGILMITFYNQERAHGLAPVDAMYRAATTRMRPLLMTALSACIGLFPAAISTGIGSQVQRPLATVIVGGMLVGPVMLLLAVPALRMIFLGGETITQQKRNRNEDRLSNSCHDRLCRVDSWDKLCSSPNPAPQEQSSVSSTSDLWQQPSYGCRLG